MGNSPFPTEMSHSGMSHLRWCNFTRTHTVARGDANENKMQRAEHCARTSCRFLKAKPADRATEQGVWPRFCGVLLVFAAPGQPERGGSLSEAAARERRQPERGGSQREAAARERRQPESLLFSAYCVHDLPKRLHVACSTDPTYTDY